MSGEVVKPECGICFQFYEADGLKCPRNLSGCGHSFCSECLQSMLSNSEIRCPTCRTITTIVALGGVDTLNKNFALIDLMELLNKVPRIPVSAAPTSSRRSSRCCFDEEDTLISVPSKLVLFNLFYLIKMSCVL